MKMFYYFYEAPGKSQTTQKTLKFFYIQNFSGKNIFFFFQLRGL